MTVNELTQEMLKHPELFTESVELLPTGEYEPARKNKKKRIQKKWNKIYGFKPVYKKKKCKKLEVSLVTIIDFCKEHNYPLPSDLREAFGGKLI